MTFSKSKVALALALLASGSAFAQAKAPEPDYTLSYNVGVVSEYSYRGISQSGKEPALQGGVDYAHKSGFYLGAWGSSIRWLKDLTASPNTTKGPVEIDIYGGFKGDLGKGFSYDVGLLEYWYAGNNITNSGFSSPNTLEAYAALTYSVVTAKYSYSTTNLFGTTDSKGSEYFDVSANFDLGNGWSIVPHVGHQKVKHYGSYSDYSVTVNKEMDGIVLSASVVDTNWSNKFGSPYTLPGSGSRDLGGNRFILGIKKNF